MNLSRYLFRSLLLVVSILLFGYAAACLWILWQGRPQTANRAQVAIILGAAAYGGKPSPVFAERIRHAVDLYREGRVEVLIFTGGTPKSGYNTEAEVGAARARQNGVAERDIFMDKQSRNTWENLRNAKQIMDEHQWRDCIIVSDPYHMARVRLMARDLGLAAQLSPTPTSRFNRADIATKLKFISREVLSLAAYLLRRAQSG